LVHDLFLKADLMASIESLINFIKIAHAGQIDKGAGKPYWEHPFSVMQSLPPFASDELKQASLLHDAPEDTAFVRNGNALVFDDKKFAALDEVMRSAKRGVEIRLARERNEPIPENTPTIRCSPELSAHTLDIVDGVTNEDYSAPADLNKDEAEKRELANYQAHIIGLANSRPENPDELRLAEDRVLLKFTDMSQNVDRNRVIAIKDAKRVTRFANKYSKPFSALLARTKEIAQKYGYELEAETKFEDDGQGNKRFYLSQPPRWRQKANRPEPTLS